MPRMPEARTAARAAGWETYLYRRKLCRLVCVARRWAQRRRAEGRSSCLPMALKLSGKKATYKKTLLLILDRLCSFANRFRSRNCFQCALTVLRTVQYYKVLLVRRQIEEEGSMVSCW